MALRMLERLLFASRWLLIPFYVALVVCLALLVGKAGQDVFVFLMAFATATKADIILAALALVDVTLTGSLIVVVIFSGYANFVARIDATSHADWPEWMARIDFAGLKLKLLSSIVAISGIQLLEGFMDVAHLSDRDLAWYVGIHLTFVFSGFMLAWTDKMSEAKEH